MVLKAYELVPEAYRQRFRTLRKGMQQSFTEFARKLRIHLIVGALFHKQMIFYSLYQLFLLKPFKNTLPENVAVFFIMEHNVQNAKAARALADVLTHRDVKKKSLASF